MSTVPLSSSHDQPRVSIIILNWNGWRDIENCLQSLMEIDYNNYDVLVVDNGSTDESVQELKRYLQNMANSISGSTERCCAAMHGSFVEISAKEAASEMPPANRLPSVSRLLSASRLERKLVLIESRENCGFAKGNNIGIEYAWKNLNPDYILLLNGDTIVEKSFLKQLVSVAECDNSIGSVQSLLLKPGGTVVDSLGQEPVIFGTRDIGINSAYVKESMSKDVEIFGPCAAAALYKSEALKSAGLLDESFFLIYEDVDLSWRLRLSGFRSMLASQSLVYHKRGISSGKVPSQKMSLLRKYHSNKNWLMLAVRYYPSKYIIPLSWHYLRLLYRCLVYSFKLGKTKEMTTLFLISLRQRKDNQRNPILKTIQENWIKKA